MRFLLILLFATGLQRLQAQPVYESLLLLSNPVAASGGSLTNENVYRWYDADYLALIDGDFIDSTTAWTNRAYAGDNLTGVTTTRPTFRTGIQNGRPGILFDGTDDITSMTAIGNHSAITITIVVHSTFTPSTATVGLMDNSGDTDEVFLDQSAVPRTSIKITDSAGSGGQSDDFPTDVLITNAMMVTWACSGSGCDYYMNGTNYGTDAIGSFSLNLDRVGTVSGNQFKGYLHEIIINTNLTATALQVSNLWAVHISNKWFAASASTLNTDLIAYWKLDEASGTRNDSEPTGTAQNLTDTTTVPSATGKINNGGAFEFDDAENINRADSADLSLGADTDFTICAWVNLESKPAFAGGIVSKNGSGNACEYEISWDAATDRFQLFVGNGSSSQGIEANNLGAPSLATWYFIVAWHDSAANTLNIQVNNGTADSVAWTGATQDAANDFRIGGKSFNGGFAFDGIIDEVGFWKKVLTAGERTELYNGGTGKSCCPF